MRLFPILTAIVVSALIYVFVFERDRLIDTSSSDTERSAGGETFESPDTANSAAPEDAPVRVVAIASKAREIDSAVVLRGQTEAFREVALRAETSGLVISTPLRKGAIVDEGDLLCELDPGTRMASLAEAQARLAEAVARVPEAEARIPESEALVEEAEARVEEAKALLEEALINANAASKLSEGGFASETRVASTQASVRGAEAALVSARAGLKSAASNLETTSAGIEAAKAGVESARAAVATAEREIELLRITAPFSGLLESDTAEIGSLLQPGDLCATVIQLDPIVMVGFVPEADVTRVALGASAVAELINGERIEGTVSFLSRSADENTRTFRVELRAPNADLALRDGQTAEIFISAEGSKAHLLPQSVLTLDNTGQLGVRIVKPDNTVAFQAIKLLRDTPTGVWISGLDEEVDVIVIGQEFVTDGVRVAVTYQEATQ